MNDSNNLSVLDQVIAIIADISGKPKTEINADTELIHDLELDSLAIYEIVIELEGKFDLQISDEDIEKIRTVSEAVAYIVQNLKNDTRGLTR